jgi:PAS domain S-box-containing protein
MSGDSGSQNRESPGGLGDRVPEVLVRSAQIRQLYSQVRIGRFAAVVAALALAALLWQVVPHERVLGWLAVFLAIQIPRNILVQRFRSIDPQEAATLPWGKWFLLGSGTTALLFGSSAVVIFPSDNFVHQCILATFLGGFAASTAVAHAPLKECYVSSVLLTMLPLLGRFLHQGGEAGFVLAAVGLGFSGALLGTGNSLHRMIVTSIRLRFQRDETIRNLQQVREDLEDRVAERTSDLASKNDELSAEIGERRKTEEAFSLERTRFRALAENLPLGLVSISEEGNFQYVNRKFRELFGYELENIPDGRQWFRLAYPDPEYRRQVIARWIEDLRETKPGEQRPREFVVTCKDGSSKTVLFRPVQLTTGDHLMTCEDVTERRAAETALEEHISMMEAILDKAADGICVCHNIEDFPYVRFTQWNPRMTEITGYSISEINQTGWHQTVYTDDDTRQAAIDRMARMRDGDDIRAEEWVITAKDGTERPVSISTSVVKEQDGRVHVLALMQDVTERKIVEDRLRNSERQYRMLAENISDVIWTMDLNLKITYISPSVQRMHGWTCQEWLSFSPGDYLTPMSLELVARTLREELTLQASGKLDPDRVTVLEVEQYRKDGTTFWTEITARFLYGDGQTPVGIIGTTRDITDRKKSEEQLKQEREFTDAVIRSVPGLLYLYDESGRLVRWNTQHEELTGYSAEEMRGMHVLDWFGKHEPDTALIAQRVQEVMTKGRGEAEANLITKDGRAVPFYFTGVRLTIAGRPYFTGVGIDITERKKAEEALRQSEGTLRTLLQAAPIGIGQVSADRTLGWTNQVLCSMLGYSGEELAGESARILYENEEEFLRVGREKHPEVIRHGTGSVETRFQRKDGSVFDVLLSSSSVSPGDLSHGMVFTAMDITERKRWEQQMKRLGAAVESAGETIVVTDSAGSIIYVNPTFEEITGYSRQEALGKNPRILKSGKHDRAFYREMWDTLLAGQVWRGRFTNKRKDGTLFEETGTISPIKDKRSRIVNYVAVKRDVTGEAMLQKQLLHAQKMEAIGTLAGGMAHDFNNLLQAILGYSDLLLMKKGPGDPDRKKLEVIQHAARDGADLVSRILTFSRKAESRARPIDLNEEIRKAQELLRRTLPRMIEIELLLAKNLQIVDADPAQVEQILLNLAINAQHAMPNGGKLLIETSNVSLSDEYLQTHLEAQPGHYVLLTVSDTGVGIEPTVLDRIFEPFFTTKTNGEGTGLGLSMVHGIVAQHGGYIRCYSEIGRGTSFKIYFPVSAGELISDMTLTREMPAFGTETILLVDDDDRIREMGRQMIEMGGYKVLVARSGEEALEMYAAQRDEISVVILDLIMPGMGGNRCLEELLRTDPDIRVLVASGYSSNGLSKNDKGSGARGFVKKPYDAKDILTAIRRVLDKGHI